MKDLLRRLGKRIRDLRQQKGWSQEEFADVCGVHRTYMGHLERGEKNLSFSSIVRVATALEMPLSSLFDELEVGETTEREPFTAGPRRSRSGLDQSGLLREVRVLERSVAKIKETIVARESPTGTDGTARRRRNKRRA